PQHLAAPSNISILVLEFCSPFFWKVFHFLQAFSHQFARSSREAISRKPSSDAVFKTRSRDLVRQFAKAGPFASIHPETTILAVSDGFSVEWAFIRFCSSFVQESFPSPS